MDGAKALFSSRFAGSVGYYAAMLYYGKVIIDHSERYNKKNKSLHRMDIIGTNGCQMLSASLVKPNSAMAVGDVSLSEHGNWRHNHWGALFSAYGRTPYFDYFADELHSIYFDLSITGIAAFNERLHRAIIDFLELPIETYYLTEKTPQNASKRLAEQESNLTGSSIAYTGIAPNDGNRISTDIDNISVCSDNTDDICDNSSIDSGYMDMCDSSRSRNVSKDNSASSYGDGSVDLYVNNLIDRSCIDRNDFSLIGDCVDMCDGSRCWDDFKGGCSEYYQIWQSKFGFTPNLSILDLLFNEGKEAIFHLLPRKS